MSLLENYPSRTAREAVVLAHIEAENTGNVDATIASFHAPRYNVIPMGAVSDGEQAVRDLIGGLLAAFPDFRFTVARMLHTDEAVVVEGVITGTHRADWGGMPALGHSMEVPCACIFDFDGDNLVNETVYFDFATLQRQLGG